MDRYWQCDHCSNKRVLKCPGTRRGATSYPIRHPKNRHFINLNADHQALLLQLTSLFGTVAGAVAGAAASAATTAVLCLPNAEMTLDLEANEVEVKVLTSLALIAESTTWLNSLDYRFCSIVESESASEC
jgi:hypothetical protein